MRVRLFVVLLVISQGAGARTAIGENLENDKPKSVTTSDDPDTFVSTHMRSYKSENY